LIYAVIMAGGSGTRFWPLSRRGRPKQFLAVGGKSPLLRATAERVLPLCGWERLLVVATASIQRPIRRLLPELLRQNLIIEPCSRNTAPAIGLASALLRERDPQALLMALPADQVVHPAGQFRSLLRAACAEAATGALVTLGVTPTRPETGFGYIEVGKMLRRRKGRPVYQVVAFREKPELPRAVEYVKDGRHFWNAGIFVFRAERMLDEIERHLPRLHAGLKSLLGTPAGRRPALLKKLFSGLQSVSIDYGIMEKTDDIQMIPCSLAWSDVGSWAAFLEVEKKDAFGSAVRGDVVSINCRNCVLQSEKRLLACIGIKDLVVVETADAVLVCPLSEAQAVRQLVEELARRKRREVL
jgi:mannose-1-phosphate guanylyltransferase